MKTILAALAMIALWGAGIYITIAGVIGWFATTAVSFGNGDWVPFFLMVILVELLIPYYGVVSLFKLIF